LLICRPLSEAYHAPRREFNFAQIERHKCLDRLRAAQVELQDRGREANVAGIIGCHKSQRAIMARKAIQREFVKSLESLVCAADMNNKADHDSTVWFAQSLRLKSRLHLVKGIDHCGVAFVRFRTCGRV
jgi:hypothetical protein